MSDGGAAGSIRRGLEQAIAYARGEADEREYRVHIPERLDVRAIRGKLGMTRMEFDGSGLGAPIHPSGSASTPCATGNRGYVPRRGRRAPTS